ncbi:hypothetical protein TELCIR_17243 [Teladorsagia circumcincta]|uniref:Uncharacterized protein n=1 Tax=Teladorsagia circumcincta TaxID=45464 RepID=A0A2G9TUW9_TELCI|nr:hypothetical protein TELCIR_17243 [Teladorsagia circumcincta]
MPRVTLSEKTVDPYRLIAVVFHWTKMENHCLLTAVGAIIEKDEEGRPLGPDGQVLPTDDAGNFIHPAVGPDGSPLPTDEHKRPVGLDGG